MFSCILLVQVIILSFARSLQEENERQTELVNSVRVHSDSYTNQTSAMISALLNIEKSLRQSANEGKALLKNLSEQIVQSNQNTKRF